MKLHVECYAGRKADERPVGFSLEGRHYSVEDVLDRWYEPESIYFKLRADDGNVYILRRRSTTPEGHWELVSYRQNSEPNRG